MMHYKPGEQNDYIKYIMLNIYALADVTTTPLSGRPTVPVFVGRTVAMFRALQCIAT